MALTQSQAYEEIRTSYGGSDSTRPSFLRPQYVKYNSITKSRNFGAVESMVAEISGSVGSQAGTNTLFFRVDLIDDADIRVARRSTGSFTDAFVSVGLLDAGRNPIRLDDGGFGTLNDIHNTAEDESLRKLPAGTYYITVSSQQWQTIPFAVALLVIKYTLLDGVITGRGEPSARLPLLKISGAAVGRAQSTAALVQPSLIKRASGAASGSAQPSLAIVIMSGSAGGAMTPYGRLQGNWKIAGAASGSATPVATLTSEAPYGYGY